MTKFKTFMLWLFPPVKARVVDGLGVVKFLKAIGWRPRGKE